MTDSVMTFVPQFMRSVKLGCVFTLGKDEQLMWKALEEDKTYTETMGDFIAFDVEHFLGEELPEVELIWQTLLGEN